MPSFGQAHYDGKTGLFHLGPNLTLTLQDFANLLHKDRDKSRWVSGVWWPAKKVQGQYVIDRSPGAMRKVRGGQFIWPEFMIGIDFEK